MFLASLNWGTGIELLHEVEKSLCAPNQLLQLSGDKLDLLLVIQLADDFRVQLLEAGYGVHFLAAPVGCCDFNSGH
ncbi:hypothetical protein A5757_01475 [Mycobacterium sp. 852013-51886_SCH5428379]|nr:hypothetical protein A5757_01475 [Mycobacterium sp. 852013-51886_SCH5428379]